MVALSFRPVSEKFNQQELNMWKVLEPKIKFQLGLLPLPDLLLFAYLLGLNHMQDVIDNKEQKND